MTKPKTNKARKGPWRKSAKDRMCRGKVGIDDVVVDGTTYRAIVIADGICDAMQRQFPKYRYSYYSCLFCPFMHVGRIGRNGEIE